jgi:hypothetical protein
LATWQAKGRINLFTVASVKRVAPKQLKPKGGREGSEVMNVWQKMDEGEIENFQDGLKLADKAVRGKEKRELELDPE